MAKNTGRGWRRGAVRNRTQTFNPLSLLWVKRDTKSGRLLKDKKTPWKGVRKKS